MDKYELKENLDQIFCDDVYFEFFEGSIQRSEINPEKLLMNKEDSDQVLKAREIIKKYFESIEQVVES